MLNYINLVQVKNKEIGEIVQLQLCKKIKKLYLRNFAITYKWTSWQNCTVYEQFFKGHELSHAPSALSVSLRVRMRGCRRSVHTRLALTILSSSFARFSWARVAACFESSCVLFST